MEYDIQGNIRLRGAPLNVLLYADDIIITAVTESDLQMGKYSLSELYKDYSIKTMNGIPRKRSS